MTYVYNPTMDFPADGTASGHAYWVYGVVDVRSEGFGVVTIDAVDCAAL